MFLFYVSYLVWELLHDPLLMCDLDVVRVEVAVEKGFRCFTFLL